MNQEEYFREMAKLQQMNMQQNSLASALGGIGVYNAAPDQYSNHQAAQQAAKPATPKEPPFNPVLLLGEDE